MCLITKSKNPSTSKKNIVCYKILKTSKSNYNNYYTPFTDFRIDEKTLNGEQNLIALGIEKVEKYEKYEIGEGFIHTYKIFKNAKRMTDFLNENYIEKYYIFKCIIPSGTEYHEGVDVNNYQSYASKEIKIIKKLY